MKNWEDSTAISGFLKPKFYYPENLFLQHVPSERKVEKREVNRLRKGSITGSFQEIVRTDVI